MRAALGDTLRALATRAHKKGLELVSHVEADVPDALVGDATWLRQMLLNLVGNAIKFTEKGEVVLRCMPRLRRTGGRGPVAFRDQRHRHRHPREKQETIFRASRRGHVDDAKYGGTGLGLTITARLVALMGGTITFESARPGQHFAFTLPFDWSRKEPVPAPPPGLFYQLPVLIVDDDDTNRRLLEECLLGWQMAPSARGHGSRPGRV